ncbi:RNA polymerase sigma-24 factor [Haloferula helveola]|uniref:RNA polymerase sigma-24 factor n=1 Tax=Haloferula helveola TaxID=490095 RepID=A0ABM7R9C8_9BACT|nr:RNA polymerase sigma-24 factor [Haloferula helveola]
MSDPQHPTDTELLAAYGQRGEEAAFEQLARRHVDMIFGVSLRRANNRQLAEEATQNVLLSLSKKARKLSMQERNLTGWLHRSTRFEVSKLQRREARIRKREEAYASANMNTTTHDEDAFDRLLPVLDQAIDHLRAADREVIVRRYLEGQSFNHIGTALGISEDAAQKRTSRAFDRLNQFFRRKAGVTVTGTALVMGISRHCAEAAPAACLNLAGKAASTGLASAITTATLTTMSISKVTAVAAGVVILGGAVAFIATRDEPPTETASSPATETGTSLPSPAGDTAAAMPVVAEPPVASGTGTTAGGSPDYSPNEELARLEAMSPHPGKDEFTRRLSVKHEELLKDLTGDLELTAPQVASVKQVLDTRLKEFRATLDTGPQPGDSEQDSFRKEGDMVTKAGGIIQGEGLREDLSDILSEEQLAAFDERQAKAWQTQVESHAYTEFSKLAPVLALSEEQKDRAFELLQASSEQILMADGAERAYIAMEKGQAATQMDLTDPTEMEFLIEVFEGPNPLNPGSPEFNKRIIEVVGGRINERVELLAPVLDERQTQRYHDYLVQQSVLADFGVSINLTPEEP